MSHLWSQVFRSTTEGACGGSVANVFFAEAKVCQLDVSIRVKKKVLQLVGAGKEEGGKREEEEGRRGGEQGGGRREEEGEEGSKGERRREEEGRGGRREEKEGREAGVE